MENDEIRAEIEQRKTRARSLKISETLWSLYRWLKADSERLAKDPEAVHPSVRTTLVSSKENTDFQLNSQQYRFCCYESKPTFEPQRSRELYGESDQVTTLVLRLDEKTVFEFVIKTRTVDMPDMPLFYENFGDILAFIEGAWVTETSDLLAAMRTHSQLLREARNAPQIAKKLREDMKNFGI